MPTPTIITLPLDYSAKFPEQCICCDEIPDSTIKIAQNSNNPFLSFLFPIIDFFNWSRVEIPICQSCKFRFCIQRYGRGLFTIGLVILLMFAVMPYFHEWTGLSKKIAVVATVIALMIPYFLFEYFYPRYFDTTANGKKVDYQFADFTYAYLFWSLNRKHVLDSPFRDP